MIGASGVCSTRFSPTRSGGTIVMPQEQSIACICGDANCVIPFGECHCRCGRKTKIASVTYRKLGHIKGRPIRYIVGHAATGKKFVNRKRPDGTPEIERFWSKVNKDGPIPQHKPELGPCWIWRGCGHAKRYGQFSRTGTREKIYAHRYSYELHFGPIPDGLIIDHLCRNHSCVHPDHLEAVTMLENVRRGLAMTVSGARVRARTYCPSGHPYSQENTYIRPGNGHRICRACVREREKRPHGRKLLLTPEGGKAQSIDMGVLPDRYQCDFVGCKEILAGVNHWWVVTDDPSGVHIFKWKTCPEDAMKNGKHFCGFDHMNRYVSKILNPDETNPERESTLELKPPLTRDGENQIDTAR